MMRNNFKGTISAFFTSTTCDTKIPPPDILGKLLKNDMFTVLLVNNTAAISGDILYGGNVDKCYKDDKFKTLFHYPQQTGLSIML